MIPKGFTTSDPLFDLFRDFAYHTGPVTFTLTGLTPNEDYIVTVYSYDGDNANNGGENTWTTNGGSAALAWDDSGPGGFASNFVTLPLTADGDGEATISGTITARSLLIWNGFGIAADVPDTTDPTLVATDPAVGATDAPPSGSLVATFDEDVQAGASGDITIHLASDNSVVASIDVNSTLVTFANDKVTIDPPADLAFSTSYYVNIPAGAITDLATNPYAGITDTTSWSFTTAAFDPALFADTFNRPDSSDLNASASGKSGTLGTLDWVEVKSAGEPTVTGNTLRLGESGGGGGGYSLAYPDHNFIDSSIASSGEFTVSVDLGATGSGGGTRFSGIAVGNSKAELDGWSTSSPTLFTSDFFFGYDPTGTTEVKIFRGGQQVYQQTINLNGGGTLSVRFHGFSDFNANTTVSYEAFINGGSPVATGSFFWSGTDENYIALYSNYTLMQGILDNFEVRTATGTPTEPFDVWADSGTLPGTVTFEGDLNGDGVQDGIAFLLGVANPDDDATGALPTVSEDGSGGLQMTFDCLPVADRGTAKLYVQHSSDLSTWTPSPTGVEVPDTSGGPTSNVTFSVAAGSPLNTVTATIDSGAAAGGKLFGRLAGTE
ncbi:Ig-like domain-containing protein [Haloferula sp. A504]|uniref:Ig-like domain-containing protein n=1 Tax=Haloferula sp. A504 TaxID=3373601 RepID=UPI0031C7CE14|nr:Ig-like domain-containing protein [Verrucomicrobiaceae bacterium E54]